MTDFPLDTSGVVPFDGGTLGVISWDGLGQLPNGPFVQGYVEAMKQAHPIVMTAMPDLAWERESISAEEAGLLCNWAFSDLASETLARIIEDCAAYTADDRWNLSADMLRANAERFWWKRQNGKLAAFPPLTVYLGDDGLIRFREGVV